MWCRQVLPKNVSKGLYRLFSTTKDDQPQMVRISKLMANQGLCSRREADAYIARGLVTVDGDVVTKLGTKCSPTCDIQLLKQAQRIQENKVSVLLNKPLGYVSSQPESGHRPAVKLLTYENEHRDAERRRLSKQSPPAPRSLKKLATVGRLDVNSSGLLLFTQDGTLAKKIIGETGCVEKEYLVRVSKKLEGSSAQKVVETLLNGIWDDGQFLKAKAVERLNENQLKIMLTEGRYRQIRRMCDHVGLEVAALKRVRIGNLMLGNVPPGKWRYVRPDEIQ